MSLTSFLDEAESHSTDEEDETPHYGIFLVLLSRLFITKKRNENTVKRRRRNIQLVCLSSFVFAEGSQSNQ